MMPDLRVGPSLQKPMSTGPFTTLTPKITHSISRRPRIDVVAQIDRIELAVAQSVQREPAARGSAFTVLLIVTLLGLDEFRSKRQNPILAGFDDAGGHDGMKVIDLPIGVFAGRAIPARQFVRAKILRPVQGDQRVAVQAGQRRQRARGLHRRQSFVEQPIEARRFDAVEHGPNVIVAGNTLHSQQGLAIRPTVSDPLANLTLMRQKRRALHEKRRKPRQSDIPHRKLRVLPPPLVRQARAGPSDTLDQIIETAHRIVESELDPKHKGLFRKIAKMRIAESQLQDFSEFHRCWPRASRPGSVYLRRSSRFRVRMRVTDIGGEEFEEAIGSTGP